MLSTIITDSLIKIPMPDKKCQLRHNKMLEFSGKLDYISTEKISAGFGQMKNFLYIKDRGEVNEHQNNRRR